MREKRISRRPQHYECDTYSTLSRKRCALRKRPTLQESKLFTEEQRTVIPSTSRATNAPPRARATAAGTTRSRATRSKVAEKKVETEKKVSRPRTRSRKSEPVHGAVCWNNVCDCVLLEILRSQPLVSLLEKKGKIIKIAVNPDDDTTSANADSEEADPPRKSRKARADSNATEC
ncbi:hypothetical protein GCK32_002184 [Trichostrongylus colubriformis]|uniref:Uncharacterized protein n=1 Tax=Trichostrongylus colubriformis TaxID=6319 RepID=A0AAN8ISN6_TRICO